MTRQVVSRQHTRTWTNIVVYAWKTLLLTLWGLDYILILVYRAKKQQVRSYQLSRCGYQVLSPRPYLLITMITIILQGHSVCILGWGTL